jgi:alpha-galactosidase
MPITVIPEKKLFCLTGSKTSYIFAVDHAGLLKHLYWGRKISCFDELDAGYTPSLSTNDPSVDLTPEEYPVRGGFRYRENCLEAEFADGTRDLVLKYTGYKNEGDQLTIILNDPAYNFEILLCYRLIEDLDIIERWTEIKNGGSEPVMLRSAFSAAFNFETDQMNLTNVSGYWGAEQRRFTEKLSPGRKVFESRKGTTGHNHGPFFILDSGADEDSGNVYFAALAYTGNFRVCVDTGPYGTTRAVIGINNFDFSWKLNSSETFITPSVFCGCSSAGYGGMSRRMHRLCLEHIMPAGHAASIRPVLYNSWEATGFAVTAENQIALAEKSAAIGAELFVLDDGWFGARNGDNAGLGDWQVNSEKFPRGLDELIKKVNDLGMDFGIWIEPEMVNPDSDLFREHPEWIYSFPRREPGLLRNQLALNLCLTEVEKYITEMITNLLENHNIKFIKWDINRPISEPGAMNLPPDERQSLWHRHTLALYRIVDAVRSRFPEVTIEACASGGGRTDPGALQRFDQFWPSDNTDALDRLHIQEGYSLLYPAKAMRAWVTDCPNFINKRTIPLSCRFHCSMTGALGIGLDLNSLTSDEIDECKKFIAQYKSIRHIIQRGDLYRISSIENGFAVIQYVLDKNESVLFAFTHSERYGRELYPLRMKGLAPDKKYSIDIDGFKFNKSGEFLMEIGISLHLQGDYASKLVVVSAV